MKTIHAHLRLSTNLKGSTPERCPDVVFTDNGKIVAEIRSDTRVPKLPIADDELGELVIHDDALSRVVDEEAWLHEIARLISPGGILHFTLPASGLLAWIDPMNAYRYLADISGRGHAPDAANPTGWNRHFSQKHIHRLLADAGFQAPEINGQNHALQELGLLVGLIRENWIRQDRAAEQALYPRFGKRNPHRASGWPTTTWSVSARKP